MGILNVGTQALQANSVALQTIGNNIANANTAGYSRQNVTMTAAPGQYTGGGYIGQGVSLETIKRNYDAFLGSQATLANSVSSSDTTRATQMQSLQNLLPGGTSGVGQSISDMFNSFADVASTPTDLTARTVALTNVNETAARISQLSASLDELQAGIVQPLKQDVNNINTIAGNIAQVNGDISRAMGNGQPPNDLLDKRDKLIADLNKLIQTTQIPASDGTVSVFVGGSQALVLGTTTSPISITKDDFNDSQKSKISINRNGTQVPLDEATLGGGSVAGLLKFQNTDLNEARNLLGRLTLAATTAMNAQSKLGLDLDGNPGGNMFTPANFGTQNILPRATNAGSAQIGLEINDVTKFEASDYEVNFTTSTSGTITRLSDGVVTAFPQTPATTAPVLATVDGLNITLGSGTAAAGDSFEIKPFNTISGNIQSQFSSPRSLAVACPVAVAAGNGNLGTLTISSLKATNAATPIDDYSIQFNVPPNGPITYNILDTSKSPATTVATAQPYTPGTPIKYAPSATAAGFSLTLTGTPANGDTMTVKANPYPLQDGGNAKAMLDLRDVPMFDGAATTDGYAGMLGQIGVRAQSAIYSSQVSSGLATAAQSASTSVSGVNLDEEAAHLLQYQQAYQASSKMIQISQTIFTTLIQDL